MKDGYVMYGWQLSYYSAKVRSYLRYKAIPFTETPVNFYTLYRRIQRETGVRAMPVLRTPEQEWIADSSVIIERMEQRFPALPVIPETPRQRFAAYLLEAWGDEWWIPTAMHTRWSYPENYALFEREAGAALLPHFPGFIQRAMVARVAKLLRSYLHRVGVRPEQLSMIEAWTRRTLGLLDAHFALQPYLLGGHPTLADFGLIGSLYAHLGRDPWPARELIAPHPHVRAWIDRMSAPTSDAQQAHGGADYGPLLADDQIAPTLEPILRSLCTEFVPLLSAINMRVLACLIDYPSEKVLPRSLEDVCVPTPEGDFRRAAVPYSLWMAQRTLDAYRAMQAAEQTDVRNWITELGGSELLTIEIPRLRRDGLRVAAE